MPTPLATYVEQRTSILARAFLTRQKGVVVSPVEVGGIDLIAHFLPDEPETHGRAIRTFGVIGWGTQQAIPNVLAASRHANQRWKKSEDAPHYYVPTLVLLFSMEDDNGYHAWGLRPWLSDDNKPRLSRPTVLECKPIERDSIKDVIEEVNAWYDQLDRIIFGK